MACHVGKLLEGGVGLRQRILQLLARGLIAQNFYETDYDAGLVTDRIHESIGEELGSVLPAMPADIGSGAILFGFTDLRFAHLNSFVSRSKNDPGVLSHPF